MLSNPDAARTQEDDGVVWRTTMLILTPVRLVLRGLLALFWLVNDLVESVLGAAARAVRPAGSAPLLNRGSSRTMWVTFMYILLGAVLLFELAPFYFIFITAFKSKLQIQQIQSMFWPAPWTLDNFRSMLFERQFLLWYWNTIVVAVVSTVVSLISASLGAYALVRLKWRGAAPFSTLVLVAYLMPTALMFIPLYYILAQLQLTNSLTALMVTYPSVVLPFATWLMMGYYRAIPEELEDAAMIDGCGRFGAFFRVVLPLVRPALLAVAMFSVTQSWNEFLYAYMFTTSDTLSTLPVGLGKIIIGDVQPWGELMAAALMTALPVVILYMVGQKFMVAGLTAGSVKG
jgi:multiple sugar transport system permease protein